MLIPIKSTHSLTYTLLNIILNIVVPTLQIEGILKLLQTSF